MNKNHRKWLILLGTLAISTAAIGCGEDEALVGSDPVDTAGTGGNDVTPVDGSGGTDAAAQTDVATGTDSQTGTDDADATTPPDSAGDADTSGSTDDTGGMTDQDTTGSDAGDAGGATDQDTTGDTTTPDDTTAPSDTAGPDDTTAPSDTAGPDDTTAPSDTASPDDTTAPDDTTTPNDTTVPPDGGVPACTKAEDCPAATAPCTVAACTAGVCGTANAADGATCSDGNACTDGDTCKTGSCQAGAPKSCDDGNACTVGACDAASGLCSSLPMDGTACDDGNACTTSDACDKNGQCAGGSAQKCDDGNPCTDDACDPAKGCGAANNAAACGADDKCLTGGVCKEGKCAGTPVVCDDGNPCTKDACDSKLGCVASAFSGVPCEDGSACTEGDLCTDGKCAAGKAKDCNDGNPCSDDKCDSKLGCVNTANTAACDDGDKCSDKDTCKDGKCAAGAALKCDDANPCTDEKCDPKTGCVLTNNTLPCTLGTACESGACSAGKCVSTGSKSCDDGNPCTKDSCDAAKGCVAVNVADASVCAKGDLCVTDSLCKTGKCEVGVKTVCDDKNVCTDDVCDAKLGCNFFPNTAKCEDGDACTIGDTCAVVAGQGAKCNPGKPIDLKTCDDANSCTTDSCDKAKGCVHNAVVGTPVCDDGNKCTVGETCTAGKCQNGKASVCDDGKICTTDNCDPATAACSWTQSNGVCDDGNGCTESDTCVNMVCTGKDVVCDDKNPCTTDACDKATGKCVATALNTGACSDGDLCTANDACVAGKCTGKAATCDDGNACTDDKCDPASGKCFSTANTAPCTGADLCTTGGVCANGACKAGSTPKCDDKNPCTVDACDAKTGTCSAPAGNDGAACDDGATCSTASECQSGVCAPKTACQFSATKFDCNTNPGWTIVTPAAQTPGQNRNVKWAIDNNGQVNGADGCSMNFNDGNDYCDGVNVFGQNLCQLPTGTTTSPTIDLTATSVGKLPAWALFDIFYDVDIMTGNSVGWNAPKVTLIDVGNNNAVLASWVLPVTNGDINVWKKNYKLPLTAGLGKKVALQFSINLPFTGLQWSYDQGNAGKGVYVDNFRAEAGFVAEICGDGIDNNNNGLTDCADATCAPTLGCCALTDTCASLPVVKDEFACTNSNWNYTSSSQSVVWNVDQTPVAPAAKTGQCRLNYNDGTDYQPGNGGSVAGGASWKNTVDLTKAKSAVAVFWAYQDVEDAIGQSAAFDRLYLQVTSDNYNNCQCNSTQVCSQQNNTCNTNNTLTYVVPKDTLKTWQQFSVDLTKFAGKSVTFRFKFDSGDNQNNNLPGVFIDDLRIYAQ
jgi:hypothetical protein